MTRKPAVLKCFENTFFSCEDKHKTDYLFVTIAERTNDSDNFLLISCVLSTEQVNFEVITCAYFCQWYHLLVFFLFSFFLQLVYFKR